MANDPYAVGPQLPGWDPSLVPPPGELPIPPDPAEAYPGASQQQALPNDFFARLAQSQGPAPFKFNMRREPSGIEVMLGLAAALGNAKTAQGAKRTLTVEDKNKLVRDSASELAKHRHELRKSREMAQAVTNRSMGQPYQVMDPATGLPTVTTKGYAIGKGAVPRNPVATVGPDGKPVLTTPGKAAGQEPYYKPPAPGSSRYSGGPGSENTPEHWATMLETFQSTMSQVPSEMRNRVVDILSNRGSTVIPKAARDAVQSINGGLAIINELETQSKRLKRGKGMGRYKEGIRNVAGAMTQTNPNAAEYDRLRKNLSNFARAMGERGVLTDQDIARVLGTIPDLMSDETLSANQFQTAKNLMEEFKQRSIQSYTTSNPAGTPTAAPTGSSAPADTSSMTKEQKYQRYLEIVKGKK